MIELKWIGKALADLVRLFEFLAPVNRRAAARAVQTLTAVPTHLLERPRIGEQLDEFKPREVRRILVGHYEMRYEIRESTIHVLRIWHTREKRGRSTSGIRPRTRRRAGRGRDARGVPRPG